MKEELIKIKIKNELNELDVSRNNIESNLSNIYDEQELEEVYAAASIIAFFLKGGFSEE